jgi:streptomycin 3"-adenylyltransferase
MMTGFEDLINRFVSDSRKILDDRLTGIYLHGSMAMGCFNPDKSDIDLITVIDGDMTDDEKLSYLHMLMDLNGQAPEKGIEMSIVRLEDICPFIYPTPYIFHFSEAHAAAAAEDPLSYVRRMKGTDRDLAAHFTVIRKRGKVLFGKPADEVFEGIDRKYYLDSILSDIGDAETDILRDPLYFILNLLRVLAYIKDGQVLSKREGGEWGLVHIDKRWRSLINDALYEYGHNGKKEYSDKDLISFAKYITDIIRSKAS